MRALLDTCTIIWAVSEPSKLSEPAASALRDEEMEASISPISCAEVACLAERGKIALTRHWKQWFDENLSLNEWEVLDITLGVAQEAYSLPGSFHRDPADRILVATARVHGLTLITADQKLLAYPHVTTLW